MNAARKRGEATTIDLPSLVVGLPAAPPAELDSYLDAAGRCFARHGITRTTVSDVSREMRVSRATVYRQVGSVEAMARLFLARELRRVLSMLSEELSGPLGPQAIVDLLAAVVRFASEHPVLVKVLADEPEIVGPFLLEEHAEIVARMTVVLVPLLAHGMTQRRLARRKPAWLAEWLVRSAISLLLAPPPGDPREFLAELLLPVLTPEGG